MGQEASIPVDGRTAADELEEQAKAPPSSVNPNSHGVKDKRKFLFVRNGGKDGGGGGALGGAAGIGINNSEAAHHTFEQREAARAAAAGGNLYLRQETSSEDYKLQKMPSKDPTAHHNGAATNSTFYHQGGMPIREDDHARTTEPDTTATDHNHYATTTARNNNSSNSHNESSAAAQAVIAPGKKSLFPTRSARGMINSMRNLSIGSSLRKQKEVQDWEKQWDEDDDDSEEDEIAHVPTSSLHHNQNQQQHHSMANIRPGMDAGHSQASAVQQQQHQQAIPPPPAQHPKTPPPKASLQHRYPSAPLSPTRTPPPPRDLLSAPVSPTGGWDTTPTGSSSVPTSSLEEYGRKPDVKMFLPMLRVLGKGSFGKVVLVQKRQGKERGQLFAMKILRKTHLVKRRQIERTRTERKVLSVVNHPFIMKLHYAFQTEDKLYLVLDYCPGGELFFHLSRFRRFPERVARFYAAELLLAIGHLHKRGIIYRDLKPENVLLDAEGHVKLGDFGLAKAGIQHPYEGANSMCGTPEYMAPEVLCQQGHGFCVDYWGLGMIVYEMMTGLPPWYTTDRQQLFRRLKSAPLDIPSYFSSSSAECVTALLERNPRRRLGVTGIRTAMEHDFFRNISWRALYSRRVEAPVRPCEGWKPPEAVKEDSSPFSAPPPMNFNGPKQFYADGVEKLDSSTLDTATQNFDAQFTRMPVESVDRSGGSELPEDHELMDDLDESTFLGFSFDIIKEKDKSAATAAGASPSPQHFPASRQRTQQQQYRGDS